MTYSLSTWPHENGQIEEMNPVAERTPRDKALIRRFLDHKHMVETIERFEWKNLPPEIPSDLIERVLYFRFKGALFRGADGRYMFLPFTLRGKQSDTIDSYGRYLNITPVLFTGQWLAGGDGKKGKDIAYMTDKAYSVIYDLPNEEGEEEFDSKDKAVILTDSSLQISQDYTPMSVLSEPINEQLSDILVLVNMDLINSAKVFTIVAKDEEQKAAIEQEFSNMDKRILNGRRVIVVTSAVQLQELTGSAVKDTARYFQSYQSIDNLRKDIIGVSNGGTFQKQEHMTDLESTTNGNMGGSAVMNNALRQRKDFCELVNAVFEDLNIDVDIKDAQSQNIVEQEGEQTKDRNPVEGGE